MIGKIIKGQDFGSCISYVLGKEEAKVIDSNVIGDNPSELSRQFDWHCQINPSVKRRVYHLILSTSPEEVLTHDQWRAIAADYLTELKLTDVPYLMVQHTDRPHHHLHIVTTRIKADGTCVKDGCDHTRSQKIIENLELTYQLKPKISQLIKEKETEQLDFIRQSLDNLLINYNELTLNELMRLLLEENIQVSLKRTDQRKTVTNLFYEYTNVTCIDSKLGQDYTLSGLHSSGILLDFNALEYERKNQIRDLNSEEIQFKDLLQQKRSREIEFNNFKLSKSSTEYTLSYQDEILAKYTILPQKRALVLYEHPQYQQYLSTFWQKIFPRTVDRDVRSAPQRRR